MVNWEMEEGEKMTAVVVYGRAQSRNLFITSLLPIKVVFHLNSFSIEGCLPAKVIFYRSSSSIEGRLPLKAVSIEGHLPTNVVFHQRSSSIEGRLPSKVVFHRRSSSASELPLRYPRSESSNMSLVV